MPTWQKYGNSTFCKQWRPIRHPDWTETRVVKVSRSRGENKTKNHKIGENGPGALVSPCPSYEDFRIQAVSDFRKVTIAVR